MRGKLTFTDKPRAQGSTGTVGKGAEQVNVEGAGFCNALFTCLEGSASGQ
jgi:hypothetical protein